MKDLLVRVRLVDSSHVTVRVASVASVEFTNTPTLFGNILYICDTRERYLPVASAGFTNALSDG